jgi:hypothetical protein
MPAALQIFHGHPSPKTSMAEVKRKKRVRAKRVVAKPRCAQGKSLLVLFFRKELLSSLILNCCEIPYSDGSR